MKKGISQEGLKLLACLTMLLDHIGYVLVYPLYSRSPQMADLYILLRSIGRVAFPVYCFLLTEGFAHTRSRGKYALRLAVGAVLAEIPYDLALYGGFSWKHQSVMLTLLLGIGALAAMEKCQKIYWKPLAAVPFAVMVEILGCDYGWMGIALIGIFVLSREYYARTFICCGAMLVLFHYAPGAMLQLGNITVPMQALAVLSMLFIANYDGHKMTNSRAVQWAFYLFYPVHLLVLWLISLPLRLGMTL